MGGFPFWYCVMVMHTTTPGEDHCGSLFISYKYTWILSYLWKFVLVLFFEECTLVWTIPNGYQT